MANHRAGSVIFCDTTAATFVEAKYIKSVRYIGASSGTLQIQDATSGGKILWQASGTADLFEGPLDIVAKDGIYVALTNSAKVYIYLG